MSVEILYGIHSVKSALIKCPENIISISIADKLTTKKNIELVNIANKYQIKIIKKDVNYLNKVTKNSRHQGIIAQVVANKLLTEKELLTYLSAKQKPLILILANITDPRNFAACLRSALGAGVDAVVFSKNNSASITPLVHQVSAGASYYLNIFQVTNLARIIALIKKLNIWVFGLDTKGKNTIYGTNLTKPLAIVMGSEGSGLGNNITKLCDDIISIPINNELESLNVSVASAIALFEITRQNKLIPK